MQTALDRADVLEAVGKGAEAHEALKVALTVAPEETRILERDGRLLHRLGRDGEALPALRRALELKPQNPELRAYLFALQPKERAGRSGARVGGGCAVADEEGGGNATVGGAIRRACSTTRR